MAKIALQDAIANLEKKSLALNSKFRKHHHAKKFFSRTSLLAHRLREKSTQLLAGAGLVGTIITTPLSGLSSPDSIAQEVSADKNSVSKRNQMLSFLHENMPHQPVKFGKEESRPIEEAIKENIGLDAKAYLDDQTLNHHMGYIGFEQHLYRYPGDTLANHDEIQEAGIAPGRGAFGYFAKDASQFTTQDYLREKYYCVVQTLYLENWNRDFKFLKDWYAFRKMVIINPVNGQAIVCSIGDAGPAEWTGKQFGGSPETMEYLGLNKGPRKGLVLMFFLDDPDNKVPLGPVDY